MKNSFMVLLTGLALGGCDLFKIKEELPQMEPDKVAVARVFENFLYEEDLEGLTSEAINSEDSADISDRYVRSWIQKQLLLNKAYDEINFDEAELQRKILDYRYALMVHEYKQLHIDQNLRTEVSEEEIQQYYTNHEDNFELKQNIIRGLFIKLPVEAPRISKVGKLIRSKKPEDRDELVSYCYQFASFYSVEDTVWLNFDDVIKNTPLSSIPNQEQYLKSNKYVETNDQNFQYFLYIYEYKITDQISPLEFVRDNIAEIIVNRRKIALANKLESDIYTQALNNNDFEIFNEE
ncbi:MAG: peptidyl-prolyl cis-trans isomerase [Cyclobacteriaceae bacterium]|nr:peptidyl-prolyl cis-trans isomerase [Cyclobacteriaceae bacterium]